MAAVATLIRVVDEDQVRLCRVRRLPQRHHGIIGHDQVEFSDKRGLKLIQVGMPVPHPFLKPCLRPAHLSKVAATGKLEQVTPVRQGSHRRQSVRKTRPDYAGAAF
jgi:hypothetical protein